MYSLVIADDEEVIRNGLQQVVNWEGLGFQIVSVVPDGERVLDLLREREISVVLADIRMPRLSGIELADVIHREWPDTRVVILTGHEKFEYAQRAIDCDVFSYLLKPCKESAIIEVFARLKTELDAAAASVRAAISPADGGEVLAAICHRDEPPDDLSGVPPPFTDAACAVMLADYVPDASAGSAEERRGRRAEMHEAVFTEGNRYGNQFTCVLFRSAGGMVAFVVGGETGLAVEALARQLLDRLRSKVPGGGDWTAALGSVVSSPAGLRSSYLEAEGLIGHRLHTGKGCLITRMDARTAAVPVDVGRIETLGTEVGRSLYDGDPDGASAGIEHLLGLLENLRLSDPIEAMLHVDRFVLAVRLALSEFAVDFDSLLSDWSQEQRKLHALVCLSDIRKILVPRFAGAAQLHAVAMRHPSNHLARRCVYIVRERFRENLGLELLASELDVSPTHLSRTFKQETGINFKDFLCSIRLTEARRFLETTNLKVYEIASAVGFGDEHYFSDVFKKKIGVTPAEFRRISAKVPEDAIWNQS